MRGEENLFEGDGSSSRGIARDVESRPERERDTGSEYFNAARNLCSRRSSRKELK